MFSPEADLFFREPHLPPVPGQNGNLYLLRRDVYTCMGIDLATGGSLSSRTLWPGAMTIFAGVDLLGKFSAGSDQHAGTGNRFRAFLRQFFVLEEDNCQVVYQLRNALVHSFGLIGKGKKDSGQTFQFFLDDRVPGTPESEPLVNKVGSDSYYISLFKLLNDFEEAVDRYRDKLDVSEDLQANFRAMWEAYGVTCIAAPRI